MLDRLSKVFQMDGSFYEFFKKLLWVLIINIIYVITCIPIITIGAATTAMYTVMFKIVREEKFSILKDYFSAFAKNFVQSTVIWIASAVIGFVCYLDIAYFALISNTVGYILMALAIIITFVFLMLVSIVFPVISRFEGTIVEHLKNAWYLIGNHIGYCAGAVLVTILVVGGIAFSTLIGLVFSYLVIFVFALNAFILSYMYDRIFSQHEE